jgi:hypothetical protein
MKMVGLGEDEKRVFKKRRRHGLKRWRSAFIIVLVACAAIVGTVAYYFYQLQSGGYHYVLQYRWNVPPTTRTTDAFTISGKQWKIQWTHSGNRMWDSLDISIQDANTNALVQEVNSTGQMPLYFNIQGRFFLYMRLNNPETIEPSDQITIFVDVSELR